MRCRFRVNFEVWHGALVAALGVAAMASCAGKSVHTGSEEAGGSGGLGGSSGSGSGGTSDTGSANQFPCGHPTPEGSPHFSQEKHGVLPASHRAALRLRAFDEVVAPAVALLLRAQEPAGHTRAMSATSSA